MASQNVLILSSNTGGGHRSAANALQNSLVKVSGGETTVTVTQVLEEAHYISRKAADFYNFLLRDHQDLMHYYFNAVNKFRPNESRLIFKSAMGYAQRIFSKMKPDVIVSVHPMTQHFFAYVLRRLKLQDQIPLLTVVTDPYQGFWRGWACEDVRQYYVASEFAKKQLMDFGVEAYKIQVMGMPVHSKFHPVTDMEKRLIRSQLGLTPERFTIFMNAGWVGGGNIFSIYQALLTNAGLAQAPIQVVFLAGRNEELLHAAQAIADQAEVPVKVLSFTNEIESLMMASDIMITKMGGLTTFEALSCRLPLIADAVTPPMPQESQTAAFLASTGAALMLKQPEQIVPMIESLLESPGRYAALKEAAALHGRPGASDHIAQDVLRFIQDSVFLDQPVLA
ncbi:MGDG synthase family glycosyltransferase [Vampirovibrio chlorellavorus]|uniref:MGDG synthase family glycosyltransferase n=1 Tax=Vampirovibrio chlorellavorus TaxID=758823 RepID=UPI0026EEDBD7|nr:glycosyltransferase [Vampirovibrio chlorellavorus]